MRQSFKLFLPVILVLFSMNLWGQQAPGEIITAEFVSSQNAAMAGETLDVALIVDIHHP